MSGSSIENYFTIQADKWKKMLRRILDVILFLSEGDLAFPGT